MKYLVTGGAGFIGSHLVRRLLERGDEVIVLDDLSTGRMENLRDVHSHPDLRVVIGSILDELKVDDLVHRSDVVVHLAAAVGVKLIVDEPLRSFTTNVRGSEIVIGTAHRYRRHILVASTSEIYGKNTADELDETSDRILGSPTTARWAYSTAKAVDEILALNYHRERGLPATIVRLFNTVGPGQSPAYGMVIPRLVRQAVLGEPITVYGDGLQSRCFCHVDDTVEALIRLLDEPAAIGEVYNVGSNEEISMIDLARRIVALAGSTSPIELVSYDKAYGQGFEDMRRRRPTTAKLAGLTGWARTKDLEQILLEVISDVRAEIESTTVRVPDDVGPDVVDLRSSATGQRSVPALAD